MNNKGNMPLVIGSRGSQLALWQANHVAGILSNGTTIKVIKTAGDKFLTQSLQGQADKGFFTKEIEDELLAGNVDLAVHSLKDLPTVLPQGLKLAITSKRAAVSDLLIVRPEKIDEQKAFPVVSGSIIGATSLRRQSLLKRFAENVSAKMLRGNVPTRIVKLRNGEYDAIIIAKAGVDRLQLDLTGLEAYVLNPEIWLPAPGQAVLGIEIRNSDEKTERAIQILNDEKSMRAVTIERELLSRFEGGCHAAFGALAKIDGDSTTVLAGHEDKKGNWLWAKFSASSDVKVQEGVYKRLIRVMDSGLEEDQWTGLLAEKI